MTNRHWGPYGDGAIVRVLPTGIWGGAGARNTVAAWGVNHSHPITGARESIPGNPGEFFCRFGQTTSNQCGNIFHKDQIFTYNGVDTGQITLSNACAAQGDSGGPLVGYYDAIGIAVAISPTANPAVGNCGDPVRGLASSEAVRIAAQMAVTINKTP